MQTATGRSRWRTVAVAGSAVLTVAVGVAMSGGPLLTTSEGDPPAGPRSGAATARQAPDDLLRHRPLRAARDRGLPPPPAAEPSGPAAAAPTAAPRQVAPEPAPKTTAPKTTAPKTTAPKTTAPKTTAPKTTAPKTTAPKTRPAKGSRQPAPAPPAAAPRGGPATSEQGSTSYQTRLLEGINQERAKRGLRALGLEGCPDQAAETHTQRMADSNRLFHQSMGPVLDRCGGSSAGENVGAGSLGPDDLVRHWMASSGHRANILSPTFTAVGVGAVRRSDGRWYASTVFLRR